MMARSILGFVLATTGAFIACQHRGSEPDARSSQTTTTGASVTSPEVAGAGGSTGEEQAPLDPNDPAVKLGRTICEHKLVCGDIGRTGAYGTMQGCTSEAVRHAQRELSKLDCQHGIAQGALARCETSVWETSCTTPMGGSLQSDRCMSRDLCSGPEGPVGR